MPSPDADVIVRARASARRPGPRSGPRRGEARHLARQPLLRRGAPGGSSAWPARRARAPPPRRSRRPPRRRPRRRARRQHRDPAALLPGRRHRRDPFVVELSSFQLSDLERSPHVAVVQNVVREHLDYHGTFEKYVAAKTNIARHQGRDDVVVFNGGHEIREGARRAVAGHEARVRPGGRPRPRLLRRGRLADPPRNGAETPILPIDEVPWPGAHNLLNVMPAIVVGRLFGRGRLEHRASLARSRRFPIGSSSSTSGGGGGSTTTASRRSRRRRWRPWPPFGGRPIVLLAGGHDRGQEWTDLAERHRSRRT